jgi:hypothetical protein
MAESCPVSNLEVAGTTAVYGPSDNDEVDSKHATYVNEVLCFLLQKCNIIPVDDLDRSSYVLITIRLRKLNKQG